MDVATVSRDQDTERRKFAGQDMDMIQIRYKKAKEDLHSFMEQVKLVRCCSMCEGCWCPKV